ncbi:hypothetical protein [Herbidospora yilanensis]|uniref:hypothetical protein n=1 Tax=Herbidospora yilanensis TaxID=354426 RepID=UPI0007840AD5|nr:hypothetical protein [Herbidospora yilanensis]
MQNRPFTILVAAAVVALEGLAALVMGGWVAYETLIGKAGDVMSSLVLAGFALAVGAGLVWVAWGILQLMRWSRGPAVVTQIFAVPLAISLIQAGQLAWGVPLIAAAAVILVTLLAPPSTHALMGDV